MGHRFRRQLPCRRSLAQFLYDSHRMCQIQLQCAIVWIILIGVLFNQPICIRANEHSMLDKKISLDLFRKGSSLDKLDGVDITSASISTHKTCEQTAFQCGDGTCIPIIWRCDTKKDCNDGRDEWNCDGQTGDKCNSNQFQCVRLKRCIPRAWVCDHENDCGPFDSSDEDPALCPKEKCLPNFSECSSDNSEGAVCIETEKFCNGHFDCVNDEYIETCDNSTLKADCVALNCSYGCKTTPSGAKCYCGTGQQPNGSTCEDIDECANPPICDQLCKNIPNSFECSCVAGYELVNNTICKAINTPANESASILFITEFDIRRVSLDGDLLDKSSRLMANLKTFDIWHSNRSCCLINGSDTGHWRNMTCFSVDDLNRSWQIPLPKLINQLKSVDIIRIDWISGNWYFVDIEDGLLILCDPELRACSIIIDIDEEKLNALEVDPTNGFIFFTVSGTVGSLHRANLDGTNHTIIDQYKIFYPTSLRLDIANKQVYWLETYMDIIESIQYTGKNRWSVKNYQQHQIDSIALFENRIYLTKRSTNRREMWYLNRRDPKQSKMIMVNEKQPYELRIFHQQIQPIAINPCAASSTKGDGDKPNRRCEYLCVPAYDQRLAPMARCICEAGYYLNPLTQRCHFGNHSTFLLLVRRAPHMIHGVSLANTSIDTMVPITDLGWPIRMDYDAKRGRIYFIHKTRFATNFSIESQRLDGSSRNILLQGNDDFRGFAYDWVGRNIYWASSTNLYVFSTDDATLRKTLLKLYTPESLVVDPRKGILYWSTWVHNDGVPRIICSWMDGTHERVFVDAGTAPQKHRSMAWPSSLALDYIGRKLYWSDPILKTIERIGLDGHNREVVLRISPGEMDFTPYAMAYHMGNLYFTELFTKRGIKKVPINDTKVETILLQPIQNRSYTPVANMSSFGSGVSTVGIYDASTQADSTLCEELNCPALRLPTPNGCICVCPDGFILDTSITKCMPESNRPPINECGKDRFQCISNGECIDRKLICDGEIDCSDGSDELYIKNGPCNTKTDCQNFFGVGESGFFCDVERCLRNSTLCNSIQNCVDGTDEGPIICSTSSCPSDKFQCKETKQCIPRIFRCDGQPDCLDGSDEMEDCPECAEFKCKNGVCIPFEQLCNGINNCGDLSDESDCSASCKHGEHFCNPKGCISADKLCNGIVDCGDASDEDGCDRATPPKTSTTPATPAAPLPARTTNNGRYNVTDIRRCPPNEFQCTNWLECVPMSVRCDGYQDCFDRSDEVNCTTIKQRGESMFSDMDCAYPDRICKTDGHCMRVDKLCDGITDCPDGSDEGMHCEEKQCDHNSECSHFCHNAPEGLACSCPQHLFLKADKRTCSSQHACEHWGVCSQVCEQVGKSFKCKCRDGYSLQYDQFTCRSNNPDSPYVIFSNREEIRGVDLRTLAVKNFFASLRNTIAIDFMLENDTMQIFWTDVIDDKIYRGSLFGDVIRNIEVVVHSGLLTAEGLAVDWIGHNLYWVDSNLDQIEVAQINGSFRRTLIAGDMDSPRALALDPREGLLFWTDWDKSDPRIERCSMAGEYRRTIIQVDKSFGGWPNGLTLDYAQKRIYYIDAHSDSIHTTNYDGGDSHLVIRDRETLSHPFSISLFENYVYWTDWRTNSVMRANKWTGADVLAIDRTSSQPFGIQILHSSRQPREGFSPCAENNGGCSHLCLLSVSKTYKCECPHVMQLSADNKTCIQNEQVLLFMVGTEIRGVDIAQSTHHIIPTISHATHMAEANIIDFLFATNKLYWTDKALDEIRSSGLATGNVETVLDTGFVNIGGFAIDFIARNLYVSTADQNGLTKICAANLNGAFIANVLGNIYAVSSIALDPAQGRMYFTHENSNGTEFYIARATLDGSDHHIMLNTSRQIASLTIDYDTKRLYFVYPRLRAIDYMDLTNDSLKEVLQEDTTFTGYCKIEAITTYKDEIYYAESTNARIDHCKKDDCSNRTLVRNNKDTVSSLKVFHSRSQYGENSCSGASSKCSHLCLATSATEHVCKCAIGYHKDPSDPTKCIGEPEFLFYSIGHELRGIHFNKSSIKSFNTTYVGDNPHLYDDFLEHVLGPIPRISMASTIDYHHKLDLLFYADSDKGEITSIKRDGTNRRIIVNQTDQFDASGGDWLTGFAVDWISNNIYWCDEKRNIIEVARLNGTLRYVVVPSVNKPKAIAVDPMAGYMFYISGHKKATYSIGRAGLDGSEQTPLVNQSAQILNFALDRTNQFIYWCESTANKIWRIDYNGNNKAVVFNHSSENPVALAIYDSYLLWMDNSPQNAIKMASVNDLQQPRLLATSSANPLTDFKIFSDQIQGGENPCINNNGGCEELCFFNGTHPICACSHGEVAANDSKTCVPYDEFLIYSRVVSIESMHFTYHRSMNSPIMKIQHPKLLRNTIGLSYSYAKHRIFYSDVHSSSINWVYFNGTDHQVIVNKQVSVEGLAFDAVNQVLFWTSNSESSIRSIEIDRITSSYENNSELIKQVIRLNPRDKPRGIAIESCLGMVYWTNWNSDAPSIQRAYVTGYSVENIITSDIQMPNAITIDYDNNKLYWADARLDKIERCNYDGSNRVILAHSVPEHPFAMAIHKDYLYWTDWVLHAVLRIDKLTGTDLYRVREDIGRLMGIVAVQNTTQKCESDLCSVLNGGCEDVCTLVGGRIKCECTRGKLANDGRRCIPASPKPSQTKCDDISFKCLSGECIPFQLTCDSVAHCADGQSDEDINFCNARICPMNYFMCNNRRCIPRNQTCDGLEQCGDGSDETMCDCTEDHFKCSSGQCIDKTYRCDTEIDCPDGSDEVNCPNEDRCDRDFADMIKCANSSTCYMESWRCDGEADCLDKSDEIGCPNVTCPPDSFKCRNGQCINAQWRCDSETDCADESDEADCPSPPLNKCLANYFRCGDGICIPPTWQCDDTADCADSSDEGEHCKSHECHAFSCPTSGRCIPEIFRCDGDKDCDPGGEDELNCPVRNCAEDMFECDNHQCIENSFVCDGSKDCADGSDEFGECPDVGLKMPQCGDGEFECDNGRCIRKTQVCDTVANCVDGSDENSTLCGTSTYICAAPAFFRCANGSCVPESSLCNGENDCGDWSDELTCNINECMRTTESKLCAHNCVDRKIGYECTCNPGYKVSHKDRHLCEDINECLERPCSQICTNTIGSYHCSCADGYALKNRHICKAVTTEQVKLIFSNRYYLRETDLHGHSTIIAHNLSNAVALDYDYETKCYYWSDVTQSASRIRRMCPSDNKTVDIHRHDLKNPDGLAVDWIGKNLYWCDKGFDRIEVSTLDGRYRKTLIHKDLQEPRAIAVDPFDRHIYWTDWGSRPHIGKAGLDGSNHRVIVEDGFGWPNALTISFETKELFWGDAREDIIGVCDFDGKNRRTILSLKRNPLLNLHHVFALAVWEDRIYWSDWERKSIESCHKDHADNCSTLLTAVHRPMDVRIYHSYRQRPVDTNPCKTAGCDALCLLSPEPPYYKCECPNKFYLAVDNKTCIANCTSAEFQCATTKKCVPFYWRCDTQDDCGDGSDEPADCGVFKCEPGQYQCSNKNCITPVQICDGRDQCGDGSDEKDCDKFICFDKQFKCSASVNRTAFCLDNTKRCNGEKDCPNGDDEKSEDCVERECTRDKFKCTDGKCIPQVWLCDGDKDCSDDLDERNCNIRNCSSNEFKCNSGRCIPKSWQCDGEFDCPTHEDEPATCTTDERVCNGPDRFRCNNGKCIPKRWRCDYDFDCTDKSDEINCTMRNCSESEFRCSNGRCIPGRYRCDGEFNCLDFSDEENCNVTCSASEFKCPNHNLCIGMDWKCDGDYDCSDGEDEKNCTCKSDQFQCGDGRCIDKRWRCDGWMDCLDNSDETKELCLSIGCRAHAFQCHNKRCVKHSVVCDGKDDCGDNSDELTCSSNQKCTAEQYQCERDQVCISKQFRCDGEPNCIDASDEINCKAPVCTFGACSQICLEKKSGNYNCRCADGYSKGIEKNSTCVANKDPVLLIASDKDIRFLLPLKQLDIKVQGVLPVSKNKIDVFDVRIFPESIDLYWIASPNRTIQKMPTTMFNSNFQWKVKRETPSVQKETTIISSIGNPKSLAIDWVAERIYILDAKGSRIIVTDLDGDNMTTIITSSSSQPLDIVCDPNSRRVFWSTLDNGIMSASMDGMNIETFVDRGVEWATGLTIDHATQRLYWADYRKGSIETILLNGKGRHIVTQFRNRTMMPKRLQVFEDTLYVTLYDQTIYRTNKFGHNMGEIMVESFQRASDLLIVHPLKQDLKIANPCDTDPCDDDRICLLSSTDPIGRACKCVDGFSEVIVQNRTECRPNSNSNCPLLCNQGFCILFNGKATCICPPDFEGTYCEQYRCAGYCKNHGTCFIDRSVIPSQGFKPALKCLCPEKWTGERCENPIAICHEPCQNGGTCADMESCVCAPGFRGQHCEQCDDLQCENGGACRKDTQGNSRCECTKGFTGAQCSSYICEGFCNGHGQCTIRSGNPMCNCESGYYGKQCQFDDNREITVSMPCDNFLCDNGGICHLIKQQPFCNCTAQWNGDNCQKYLGSNNPCNEYCENNGICRLDNKSNPYCVCTGEWVGERCNNPPACLSYCGDCIQDSSINECLCIDGTTKPCTGERSNFATASNDDSSIFGTLILVLIALIAMIIVAFGILVALRKRRNSLPFSHSRLNECVEMTNPMYLGEVDDTPSFIHDESKTRFTNPVYESMYADATEPTLLNTTNCNGISSISGSNNINPSKHSVLEEKTGLLEQDEPNIQDLL